MGCVHLDVLLVDLDERTLGVLKVDQIHLGLNVEEVTDVVRVHELTRIGIDVELMLVQLTLGLTRTERQALTVRRELDPVHVLWFEFSDRLIGGVADADDDGFEFMEVVIQPHGLPVVLVGVCGGPQLDMDTTPYVRRG
ncbi:hypothetical protein D3C86_1198410 [compost metagenome]